MVRDLLQLNNLQKRLFALLCISIAVSAVVYGTLVKRTVAYVVEREDLAENISDLSADISVLEGKYMAALQAVTIDRAYALGFTDREPTLFVSRNPEALSIRYDGN